MRSHKKGSMAAVTHNHLMPGRPKMRALPPPSPGSHARKQSRQGTKVAEIMVAPC
jgi:hypothetical protein